MKKPTSILFAIGIVLFALSLTIAPAQAEDTLEQGKYIATLAGCTSCHTPYKPEFSDPQKLTPDQIRVLAFDDQMATDYSRLMAGGRPFNLGPAGMVFTKNITPDKATGIGGWTDEQILTAMKSGQDIDGSILFPVMPYHVFNSMADADAQAVVAYIRSAQPVNNQVPPSTVSKEGLKPFPYTTGIVAPDASDKAARGAYLVNSVMACTDCHTPIDPATGAPQMDKYLAGGQPYEGPWGIVYGGNITPDEETGLGSWTETEIKRALVTGISRDGRRLILMPWFAYSALTPEDADAVAYYLKNGLPAVSNQVPTASLNPDFIVMSPDAPTAETQKDTGSEFLKQPIALVVIGLLVIAVISGLMFLVRRRSA